MKRILIIAVLLSFSGCDDDSNSSTDPCDPNPCISMGKTVCVAENDEAVCECEEGLFEDSSYTEVCCGLNSHAVEVTDENGINSYSCECDEGYIQSEDGCTEENSGELCTPNPCSEEEYGPHMTVCTEDESSFYCECEDGYEGDTYCSPVAVEECPGEDVCLGDVCVSSMLEEQCVADIDCNGGDPLNPTICNNTVVGGICSGCRVDEGDCPPSYICNDYGTCSKPCIDENDCPYGSCSDLGLCILDYCTTDEDCPGNSVCVDENADGQGLCFRIPCVETVCSIYNTDGDCPTGASCIGGECIDSCTPNPCTEGDHTLCVIGSDGPVCECEEGLVEDSSGNCVPEDCADGFSCTDGYCVDPAEYFQCVTDEDCGTGLSCNPELPTGTCSGCTDAVDCPSYADTCFSGYCLTSCSDESDCAAGMECGSNGYCGKKNCASNSECPEGYMCDTVSNTPRCERVSCGN